MVQNEKSDPFEAETCEGCTRFEPGEGVEPDWCRKHEAGYQPEEGGLKIGHGWRCSDPSDFKPNLQCRLVRSLEGLPVLAREFIEEMGVVMAAQ